MDFTLKIYRSLLKALTFQNYSFQTFADFIQKPKPRSIILRHDVDRLPMNALSMAKIEKELVIKSTYFFRTIKSVFKSDIIKKIADMGHEVGYHYENLSAVARRKDFRKSETRKPKFETKGEMERSGDSKDSFSHQPSAFSRFSPNPKSQIRNPKFLYELALEDFKQNLERLRKLYPVKTICMHGSPLSKIDNRDLWKVYDYRDFGIIGEPYFDVDFNEVLYLTDTGRRWDGDKVNIRDRVVQEVGGRRQESVSKYKSEIRSSKPETNSNVQNSNNTNEQTTNDKISEFTNDSEQSERMTKSAIPRLHSTFDIIDALEKNLLPDKIMINVHPQRWTDKFFPWVKELIWQNLKNVIKRFYT